MRWMLAWVVAWSLACGGSTTTIGDAGGSDGGPTNDAASNDSGGGPETGNGDSGAPCNAQKVSLTFGNCPAQPTCGGAIVDGTYDYTTGCIPDPWAQVKNNCPSLQVSNEQGSVQGCITFAAGFATRDVQSSYGATLAVPTACLLGGTCTQLQNLLSQYFTATCSPATTGCTCDVSSSYAGQGGTSYTTSNNQVVTSTNNHYDYCMGTGTIDMSWVSGPNPEPGVYTLTKN